MGDASLLLGLARYDAMCQAIVACASVDEVKEIRDKARALEVYAQQSLNTDVERKAAEIRIRAERRAGELLKGMKETGERASATGNLKRGPKSKDTTSEKTLSDLCITRDESSKWQKLAEIPEEKFEAAVSDPEIKPTTHGIIERSKAEAEPKEMDAATPESDWECSLVLKALRTQVGNLLQGHVPVAE